MHVLLELKPERLGLDEFQEQAIRLSGRVFRADRSGALYWPAEDALIVADLHLEKGSSFAARGQFLPPYDTRATLDRLAEVIELYEPSTVIALGDSFHDGSAFDRIGEESLAVLHALQEDRDWIWLTGNHDPMVPARLGGYALEELRVGDLCLRHLPAGCRFGHEIAGHLHPAARLVMHGYVLRRPCFVSNGRRLVMPAFGAYTGGLNVLSTAFEAVFGDEGLAVWMLGQEGLYPIAARLLRDD